MGKEAGPSAPSPFQRALEEHTRLLQKAVDLLQDIKKATPGASAVLSGSVSGATQGTQADAVHRETFWQRVTGISDPERAQRTGIRGAATAALGVVANVGATALGASMNPFITQRERDISTERAGITGAGGLIGGLLGTLIAPGVGTAIGASAGASIAGQISGMHRIREQNLMESTRADMGDIAGLVASGKISMENPATREGVQKIMEFRYAANQRRQQFEEKYLNPMLDQTAEALKDAATKLKEAAELQRAQAQLNHASSPAVFGGAF